VHTRGAWLTRLLRPQWSVAPRIGSKRGEKFWNGSFTHFYAAQSHGTRHTVESNLDSLRALGREPTADDLRLTMVPDSFAEARVDALLREYGLEPGRFIHVHPASRWIFKCWPPERVAVLCDELSSRGWSIVLTSAAEAKEKALIAKLLKALGNVSSASTFDLSGQLTLTELAALTARAKLFVGVDSAPMHIAAAMGTPTVAIFGPSGDREWGPWNVVSRVVTSKIHDCRPCGRAGCSDSKISECLTTLPVAQVLAACEELLSTGAV
jgi:heptosyltransferase-3